MTASRDNARPTVLLIEDNSGFAELVLNLIASAEGQPFQVDWQSRLSDGLARVRQGGIDVVLLDLSLPDSKGLVTFEHVHGLDQEIPVVVMTGLPDESLHTRAMQLGAQDVVIKGEATTSSIIRSLWHAIERQQLMRALEQRTGELRSSETRLREIIQRNADGIVLVDADGAIRLVNPATEAIFGRTAEELIGEPFGFPVVAGETTELDVIRKDGVPVVAEMRAAQIDWEGTRACLASLRDVTERKRMQAELEQTRLHQSRLKDQFLSHVSHELGSPLAVVYEFTTILRDGLAGGLTPDQREYLDIVFRNVNQLRAMIQDLLEVTRTQTGKLLVTPQRVSIAELLAQTVNGFYPAANARRIALGTDVARHLPAAHADPKRVQQILVNLLDNAIKFTPENGTVTVRADVFRDNPSQLCLSVIDTGCGIRPEDSERIFEYLYQGDNTAGLTRKGLGLGLYICRELVSRHGGTIWVESRPGQGSTFRFTMPVFSPTILEDTPATDPAKPKAANELCVSGRKEF